MSARDGLSLSGTVVGPDGRGVAAARVVVDANPARVTTTDASGTFAFDGLAPRSYVVRATSDDSCGEAGVRLARRAQHVTVELQPGVTVSVRVVDTVRGTPIAGASVAIGDVSAIVSDRGEAELRPIRPGWAEFRCSAAGYALERFDKIVSAAPRNRVDIYLSQGFAIGGVVVDEAGGPVAHARVDVLDEGVRSIYGDEGAGRTDENGRFRLADVSPGVRRICAVDPQHRAAMSPPLVVEGDRSDLRLTVREGGHLEGRVVDAAGAPVVGASVHVVAFDHSYVRMAETGGEGRFTLRGLRGVPAVYVRASHGVTVSETAGIVLSTSASQSIVLGLLPTRSLSGTVVDDRGQPCPGVSVNAMLRENDSVFSSALADENGRFIMDDLPDGTYMLWTGQFNDQYVRYEEPFARPGDADVRVTRTTFGSVRGEVVFQSSADPPGEVVVHLMGTTVGFERMYRALGANTFELDRVPSDTYHLFVHGLGFVGTRVDVSIAENQVTDLGPIAVSRGRTIAGRVIDEVGAPIAGARLLVGEVRHRVAMLERREPWVLTDVDGRFTISGLREGRRHHLVATHHLGHSRGVDVPDNETEASSLSTPSR